MDTKRIISISKTIKNCLNINVIYEKCTKMKNIIFVFIVSSIYIIYSAIKMYEYLSGNGNCVTLISDITRELKTISFKFIYLNIHLSVN